MAYHVACHHPDPAIPFPCLPHLALYMDFFTLSARFSVLITLTYLPIISITHDHHDPHQNPIHKLLLLLKDSYWALAYSNY